MMIRHGVESWLASICLVLLSGCALTVDVPVNRFDSPETTGKLGRVRLEGQYGGRESVVLTPDATVTAPDPSHAGFDSTRFVRFEGGVGLRPDLDVEIRTAGDIEVRGKYQFFGAPHLTAKEGNFSVAATLGLGVGDYSTSSTGLFSSTDKVTQSEYFVDAGLVLGYRLLDPLLIYGGPFARGTNFSGSWALLDPTSGVQTQQSNYSGNVLMTGANLGLEMGTQLVQVKIEGAYANVKSFTVDTGRFYAGLALAFQFGAH